MKVIVFVLISLFIQNLMAQNTEALLGRWVAQCESFEDRGGIGSRSFESNIAAEGDQLVETEVLSFYTTDDCTGELYLQKTLRAKIEVLKVKSDGAFEIKYTSLDMHMVPSQAYLDYLNENNIQVKGAEKFPRQMAAGEQVSMLPEIPGLLDLIKIEELEASIVRYHGVRMSDLDEDILPDEDMKMMPKYVNKNRYLMKVQ